MSRKLIIMAVVAALVSVVVALPAEAAKKKNKPKPVQTVLYLEGDSQFGEQDVGVLLAAPGKYLQLVPEPGTGEKSMGIPSLSVTPNDQCAGSPFYPVFMGNFVGTIKGDLKVSFEAVGTPGSLVEVRVWPDLMADPAAAGQGCNETYVEPAGKVEVTLPTSRGLVEAVIPGLDATATTNLVIQLTGISGSANPPAPTIPPFYGRAYYGLETTKIEFSCLPASGATSCLPAS